MMIQRLAAVAAALLLASAVSAQDFGTLQTFQLAPVKLGPRGDAPVPDRPPRLDVSGEFPTPPNLSQGPIGSCHTFASVAIVEAAIERHYHKKIKLSEADVETRAVIMKDGYVDPTLLVAGEPLMEGGNVDKDVDMILKEGVATRSDYKDFLARYRRYKTPEQDFLAGILNKTYREFGGDDRPSIADPKTALKVAVAGAETEVLYEMTDAVAPLKAEPFPETADIEEGARRAQRVKQSWPVRWYMGVRRQEIESGSTEEQLRGPKETLETLASERWAMAQALKGFRLKTWMQVLEDGSSKPKLVVAPPPPDHSMDEAGDQYDQAMQNAIFRGMDPQKCRADSRASFDVIIKELQAGRPVAVGMLLGGLPSWGDSSAGSDDGHAFVLTGYDPQTDAFMTRNSWSGINPEVRADELCRVDALYTVLAPSEESSDAAAAPAAVAGHAVTALPEPLIK